MKRVGIFVLASAALMSVVFVGAAAGHRAKFDSTVTIKFKKAGNPPYAEPATFDGTVDSVKRRCERNRTVNLRIRNADGSTTVVASDVTDTAGAWVINLTTDPTPGTYFAQATKKVLRKNANHRHICRKAVSKDVNVK